MHLHRPKIAYILIALFSIEMLSFLGYYIPQARSVVFFVLSALFLALSFKDLKFALYVILAELAVGSKGYLFYAEFNDITFSIRIMFWLIFMSIWISEAVLNRNFIKKIVIFRNSRIFLPVAMLATLIFWGLLNGFLNNNGFSNIFFDFNGWLFFLLLFPMLDIIGKDDAADIFQLLSGAVIWLALKSLILLYFFSHSLPFFNLDLYRWVRTSGVGEITAMSGGFYRIFFQSHLFNLAALFWFLLFLGNSPIKIAAEDKKRLFLLLGASILCLATVIIGFSRSNWIGLAAGLALYFIYFKIKNSWKAAAKRSLIILGIGLASIALITLIVKFPWPNSNISGNASDLITKRASQIQGEAGASSRWALLPVLWNSIKEAPVIGKGFGATVTYRSSDPRVLETSVNGQYTTYAFEWGWLDIWLKLGILGLAAYISLLAMIVIIEYKKLGLEAQKADIAAGIIITLAVVSAVSFFSPYLNHPIGIGLVCLMIFLSNERSPDPA